jgi:hypothetical protein
MTYGILARVTPTDTAPYPLTEGLLEAESGDAIVVSSLTVTNITPNRVSFSVYVGSQGLVSPSIDNALIYQQTIKENDTIAFTYGITLGSNSVVYVDGQPYPDGIFVESSVPDALTFTVFGSKVEV